MLLIAAQIFAVAFAILVVSKSYLAYKQRKESLVLFLFWLVTWLVIVAITFFPEIINVLLSGNKAGVGTVLGIAIVFLYYVIYRVYVKADRVERQMQKLIRDMSRKQLIDSPKNKKK